MDGENQRVEEVRAWAAAHGLAFTVDDEAEQLLTLPLPFLHSSILEVPWNVVCGDWQGTAVMGFDLHLGNGFRSSCAVAAISADCPMITISHLSHRHWLAEHVGHHVIETEYGSFNREWQILCEDERFASDLVSEPMIEWIVKTEPPDRMRSFQVAGSWAMCFTALLPASQIPIVLGGLVRFVGHFPEVVYELYPPSR